MIGDLFDSPWKILIVAVVIIVLFGSKKLPGAARSLGQSMRILKREVSDLHHDDEPESAPKDGAAQFPPAQLTTAPAAPPADQQGQIDALQQQIRDLQRSATMDTPASAGSAAEPQRTQQPS
jgi:sec-independent protein translocase protein TatA